ncbi:hypothetical protein PINS_up018733 [Pythium insidiosum]|nr:hypothetical protein PINS_up018733 [Pythium insidiosum]
MPSAAPITEQQHAHRPLPRRTKSSTPLARVAVVALQLVVVASIVAFAFGQFVFFHPFYASTIRPRISQWWNVPVGPRRVGAAGHPEMIRPTFFTLFATLPLLIGAAAVLSLQRFFPWRRATSGFLLRVLRRKPSSAGELSFWSYGEWLFFLLLVGGNIAVFYWIAEPRLHAVIENARRRHEDVPHEIYLQIVGVAAGFNSVFNMAFLFLPATRNALWMEFFNLSYANGIKYHRWIGVAAVFTALFHGTCFTLVWLRRGVWLQKALPCFSCALDSAEGFQRWRDVCGELSLACFLAIAITSLPIVRRKFYDLFYYTHQLFALSVVFLVLHWQPAIWWVLPTLAVYAGARAISSANAWAPVKVKELSVLSDGVVRLVLHRSPARDGGQFRVGQFVYLNVPAISRLQWHAFTIASSPRAHADTFIVLLKALGDWTSDLVQLAEDCDRRDVTPTVHVDGFYGASLEHYTHYDSLCLVGGGIGATPLFAILEDLVARRANETLRQRVTVVFSFRELALLEEVHPLLQRLQELDPHGDLVRLRLYLTRKPNDAQLERRVTRCDASYGFQNVVRLEERPTSRFSLSPQSFAMPLHSSSAQLLMHVTVLAGATALCVFLAYGGGKITRDGRGYLWMLQQLMDSVVLFTVGALVFGVAIAGKLANARRRPQLRLDGTELDAFAYQCIDAAATTTTAARSPRTSIRDDVVTRRDLLAHYGVVVGQRPDLARLMAEALERERVHDNDTGVIGVFVSGPSAMKRAVGYGALLHGAARFDIHEEEFEL